MKYQRACAMREDDHSSLRIYLENGTQGSRPTFLRKLNASRKTSMGCPERMVGDVLEILGHGEGRRSQTFKKGQL